MKARSASIITTPNEAFTKRIDPLTGRVFTDTIGGIVSSGLAAVSQKIFATVVFASRAAIDAAVAIGQQAMHSICFSSPDQFVNPSAIFDAFTNQTGGGLLPIADRIALTPASVTTSRSKQWVMDGFGLTLSPVGGLVPTPKLQLAAFSDIVSPQPTTLTVSQIIQMIGDTIESARAVGASAMDDSVAVVVSQNASCIVAAVCSGFVLDPTNNFDNVVFAKINVAANDLPVSSSGASFGE